MFLVCPSNDLCHASVVPEFRPSKQRVLQTLLDLDPVVASDDGTQSLGVVNGRIEGAMPAALIVVDVLADDFPVIRIEFFRTDDFVGVGESIQNEPDAPGQ